LDRPALPVGRVDLRQVSAASEAGRFDTGGT
jgi:hypothetical protein